TPAKRTAALSSRPAIDSNSASTRSPFAPNRRKSSAFSTRKPATARAIAANRPTLTASLVVRLISALLRQRALCTALQELAHPRVVELAKGFGQRDLDQLSGVQHANAIPQPKGTGQIVG